jgi:polyisoprenoid-binding protein YceI
MTPSNVFSIAAALTVALSIDAAAQTTAVLSTAPASKVTVSGGSNVHEWSCSGSRFDAAVEMDASSLTNPLGEIGKPIMKVVVSIPTKSVKCGKDKMDENMYKALKADQFPTIKYELTSYTLDASKTTATSFVALTEGELTVAGTTAKVAIPVTATRKNGGQFMGEGTLQMLMTDVGIKPPTALLGTMRTKNEITISFQVLLDKNVAVALTQP